MSPEAAQNTANRSPDQAEEACNMEFAPQFQWLAFLMALVNTMVLLMLGSLCLCLPLKALVMLLGFSSNLNCEDLLHSQLLSSHGTREDSLQNLGRLLGGVLLSQALACLLLLYPILADGSYVSFSHNTSRTHLSLWNMRVCIAIQGVTGLVWIVVLLLNDRVAYREEGMSRGTSFVTLLIGFGVLIFSSVGLMLSFWPVSDHDEPAGQQSQTSPSIDPELVVSSGNVDEVNSHNLTEPLLTPSNAEESDWMHIREPTDQELQALSEQPDLTGVADANVDYSRDPISFDESLPTSRIRGTRRLLSLAAPQVIYLYIGCITLLVRLPFSLAIPHFVSTTLGALSRGDFGNARIEVIWLFIIGTIDACLDFWCIFWFGYANQRIVREVRTDTFASMLKQEVAFFDSHTSGELASRLNSDCGEMAGDLTWFFRFSIESVVRITGITAYMLQRSPKLGACSLSIVPIVAIVNKYYGDWLGKNASRVQDALAAANSTALETLACVRTVISFASEDLEYEKYESRINEQYKLNIRQLYMTGIYYMFISTFLINTIVQGTLLLVGSYMIQRGNLTSEILLAFMLYQGQLQNEMMNFFNSFTSLIKSSGAGDKVFEILDRDPPPPATGNVPVEARHSHPGNTSAVSVRLENVHFFYPSRIDQVILKGINLKVDPGCTVALVGPSGCGKTTIVNLLQRYYDATIGRITFDGVDIKDFDLKLHRRRIGIVTQDPVLFSGTILSNITYGMPGATREDAVEAAQRANAHDFISAMPEGYETQVGERGSKLSGGQRQRIAISRAIIRRPFLLLLDEATSALDAESEEVVQRSIDSLLKENCGITTIVIAHRIRTVRDADMIVCINAGQIVEMGSHDELMKLANGYYQDIVSKSLGGKLMTS